MAETKFPMLAQFLGAYFHQDWLLEDANSGTIIQQYICDESPVVVNKVIQELDQLLSFSLSDAELRDVVFNVLGCYYEPEAGKSMKEWLQWVRSTLAEY